MALLAEMQFQRRNCPTTEPFIQGTRPAGCSCTKANTWRGSRELIELATAVQKPQPQTNQNHAPPGTEAVDEPIYPCPCCGSPSSSICTTSWSTLRAGARSR